MMARLLIIQRWILFAGKKFQLRAIRKLNLKWMVNLSAIHPFILKYSTGPFGLLQKNKRVTVCLSNCPDLYIKCNHSDTFHLYLYYKMGQPFVKQ